VTSRSTSTRPVAMPTRFPNYYELLSISHEATQDEIRRAYKRESLRTHPDRLSNVSQEEKLRATEKFQVVLSLFCCQCILMTFKAVADAYYVLSDPTRRKEYDTLFASRSSSDRSAEPDASSNFFANFANIFAGAAGTPPRPEGFADGQRPDAEGVFGDVFEEVGSRV
jgi:curved DNA-binding protein CbpA